MGEHVKIVHEDINNNLIGIDTFDVQDVHKSSGSQSTEKSIPYSGSSHKKMKRVLRVNTSLKDYKIKYRSLLNSFKNKYFSADVSQHNERDTEKKKAKEIDNVTEEKNLHLDSSSRQMMEHFRVEENVHIDESKKTSDEIEFIKQASRKNDHITSNDNADEMVLETSNRKYEIMENSLTNGEVEGKVAEEITQSSDDKLDVFDVDEYELVPAEYELS